MLSPTDRNIATTFKQRVQRVSPVLDLRVYGSRARGDADFNASDEAIADATRFVAAVRQYFSDQGML